MKITFILPGVGKERGGKYIKTWTMEPLTIATLKALTPPGVETGFYDDRVELIDYDAATDLVAITVETYTAKRAYEIAGRFRKRGVAVVLGGYHPTLLPEEAAKHADSIVLGNAEGVWHRVLEDFKSGCLKKTYSGAAEFANVLPDKEIFKGKKYLPLALVETGRGCPFRCEFCAISSYYKASYRHRPVKRIVDEIERSTRKFFFIVDDNIVANPGFAMDLFREITHLKIRWSSQGALTMARDRNLLRAAKKSGCDVMLIGFESLDERNLDQMKKDWNYKIGERDELIKRIHAEGISIYATFVFGFDYDTPETIERAVEFSLKHEFFFAAFNHLLPFPGTPLFDRLQAENRIIRDNWWLSPGYKYGDIPFIPKNMAPEELSERCAAARRKFFSFSSIFKRGVKLLGRNLDPLTSFIFWNQNLNLKREVNEKLSVLVGSGLDELPK